MHLFLVGNPTNLCDKKMRDTTYRSLNHKRMIQVLKNYYKYKVKGLKEVRRRHCTAAIEELKRL